MREELAFASMRAHVRIVNRFGIRRAARDQRNSKDCALLRLNFADQLAQRRQRDPLDGFESLRHDPRAFLGRQLELGMPRLM